MVGEIEAVDPTPVRNLIEAGYIPVIAPLGVSSDGICLNINAGLVASQLAGALGEEMLLFLKQRRGHLPLKGFCIRKRTHRK